MHVWDPGFVSAGSAYRDGIKSTEWLCFQMYESYSIPCWPIAFTYVLLMPLLYLICRGGFVLCGCVFVPFLTEDKKCLDSQAGDALRMSLQ